MGNKNELAEMVPAKFQEKAFDWLLQKLDEDIEAASRYEAEKETQDIIRTAAINRAKLVSDSLLAMYSPRVFKVDAEALKKHMPHPEVW
ncbi:TPA: hypothetical protein LZ306_003387 [Enterobacter bugandensis]|uniref:hypothetical protein n=1 Tax=Enterobacter TaxID=547 RepID=UPI0029850E8D|nr:hypothetical protein [Enterobacter bugandensis]HBM7621130.1 hypothetical protein [Enterobacter bugandensis]HCK7257430.1 hypothetical protein [Enterobacter bugandensis]HCK7307163.1 hypothetical protein [Enterobacter bugandensis]HCK7320871.1 hypothetical protein [Enterobacter bugandensis]